MSAEDVIAFWAPIFSGLAFSTILVVGWGLILERSAPAPARREAVLWGLLTGITCIVSIVAAQDVVDGFKFDLRHSFLGVAAYFGGPVTAVVSTLVTAAFRASLGGGGTVPGITAMVTVSAIGCAGFYQAGERRKGLKPIALLSLAIAAGSLVGFLMIPEAVRADIVRTSALPLFLLTGLGTLLTALLIAAQVRQAETQRTNRIYAEMVRELPECLSAKDLDGRFLTANGATAELMKAGHPENLIGKTDFDFYPEDLAHHYRQDELDVIATGRSRWIEQPALLPDGSPGWLSTLKAPLRDLDGRIIGLVTHNRNVTETRRMARIKEELIATVSHELRTPLTSIKGTLALLEAGVAGEIPTDAARLVGIAHTNAARLERIVNDVLDVEKLRAGALSMDTTTVLVSDALREAVQVTTGFAPSKELKIDFESEEDLAVFADPMRLQQILANLISNAMKHSPDGGRVRIAAKARDEAVVFSISDTGAGVPETFVANLFERFQQAEPEGEQPRGGSGLGLSIAREMVEGMGGGIGYERRGDESVFWFTLPRALAAPAAANQATPIEKAS